MGPIDFLIHALNFLAPALGVGLMTAIAARLCMKKVPKAKSLLAQAAINFAVGALLLLGGLAYFGQDGKVATYAALVLGCATSQWWLLRGGGARR